MNKYLCIWEYPFVETISKIVEAENEQIVICEFIKYIEENNNLIADNEEVTIYNLNEIEKIN